MPYQDVSGEVTDEQRTAVLTALATIESNVEFLINLTPLERKTIPKMGNATFSFVSKAIELALNYPEFVPPYCNVTEMKADYDLAVSLRELENLVSVLTEKFSDTGMAAGSEAFTTALTFYNSVKAAAKVNVPGADHVRQELAERFPGATATPEPPEPEE